MQQSLEQDEQDDIETTAEARLIMKKIQGLDIECATSERVNALAIAFADTFFHCHGCSVEHLEEVFEWVRNLPRRSAVERRAATHRIHDAITDEMPEITTARALMVRNQALAIVLAHHVFLEGMLEIEKVIGVMERYLRWRIDAEAEHKADGRN